MKKAVKIIIKGNVQGVFFRDFIKENADSLNLKGFVRNLENGNVEVFAEGEIGDIDELYKICKKGSKDSIVKQVSFSEEKFQDFKDFKILHI